MNQLILCREIIFVSSEIHTKRINALFEQNVDFLGAFAKFLKATIVLVMSLCPSVCLSVRMEQLGSHWADFHEIRYLKTLRKSVGEILVWLKSDKTNGYST